MPQNWLFKTNKGRVVYDRPKNTFKLPDSKRIIISLKKPYLVLRKYAYDSLAYKLNEVLEEFVESSYLMEGSVIDGMGGYWRWDKLAEKFGSNWRWLVASNMQTRGFIAIERSWWLE